MEELRKVNSLQLYFLWRNMAIALLCMAAIIAATHILPFYMAPVLSLLMCGLLYTLIWNNNISEQGNCMIVVETMLYCFLCYTFVSVLFVTLYVLDLATLPNELIFFNYPFMPSLILLPVSTLVCLYALFFRKSMPAYKQYKATYASRRERGYFSLISDKETVLQLKNITILFAVLSVVVWWYYLAAYVNVNQNGRDWYVFVWVVILMVLIDEFYFMVRYYNFYLDLLEHNEIITPDELRDITARTYLRFYVACGEYLYINKNSFDRLNQVQGVFDTPFITKRTVNGVPTSEVRNIVEKMTGQKNGELKFYFGRPLAGVDKHSLLRYFYFLDGQPSDYPDMGMEGEWVHFNEVKRLYSENPSRLATNGLTDLSRVSTIILTERLFDEDGNRKNKIKSYTGNLTLADIRNTKLDLQDDKWIKIANFNSDTKFYKLKKFFREMSGNNIHSPYHKS